MTIVPGISIEKRMVLAVTIGCPTVVNLQYLSLSLEREDSTFKVLNIGTWN
jgi:hypothetical protein